MAKESPQPEFMRFSLIMESSPFLPSLSGTDHFFSFFLDKRTVSLRQIYLGGVFYLSDPSLYRFLSLPRLLEPLQLPFQCTLLSTRCPDWVGLFHFEIFTTEGSPLFLPKLLPVEEAALLSRTLSVHFFLRRFPLFPDFRLKNPTWLQSSSFSLPKVLVVCHPPRKIPFSPYPLLS